MACPLVAGLAALVLEAYPEVRTGDGLQPYYVRRIIKDTAKDIGLPAEMQGAGLVDTIAALTEAWHRRRHVDETLGAYKRYMQALLFECRRSVKILENAITKMDQI
jgi:subtilisin family serine protease